MFCPFSFPTVTYGIPSFLSIELTRDAPPRGRIALAECAGFDPPCHVIVTCRSTVLTSAPSGRRKDNRSDRTLRGCGNRRAAFCAAGSHHIVGFSTERMLPAGSLNQAIVGPFPRMIPFSS